MENSEGFPEVSLTWLALGVGLSLLCGCSRSDVSKAQPQTRAAVADAAPAPSASEMPAVDPAPGAEQDAPGAAVAQGVQPITAEGLLAQLRASGAKGTLVNLWASWCGPCRREIPMLEGLAANLKPQGIRIVLVSVDNAEQVDRAASFLHDNHVTLPSYIVDGSVAAFKARIDPRWPGMLPASFLFDADATLRHFWAGEAFEQEILSITESFLAGRPIESETRYDLAQGKVEH